MWFLQPALRDRFFVGVAVPQEVVLVAPRCVGGLTLLADLGARVREYEPDVEMGLAFPQHQEFLPV